MGLNSHVILVLETSRRFFSFSVIHLLIMRNELLRQMPWKRMVQIIELKNPHSKRIPISSARSAWSPYLKSLLKPLSLKSLFFNRAYTKHSPLQGGHQKEYCRFPFKQAQNTVHFSTKRNLWTFCWLFFTYTAQQWEQFWGRSHCERKNQFVSMKSH